MWGPRNPRWFNVRGTNRIVEDEEMGFMERLSLMNLARSAPLSTKSELLEDEDKHDFVKPEAMITSMAVSKR